MAFLPYSYDHGQPLPSAYIQSAGGDVAVGLCLAVSGGTAALSVKPEYIALCDRAAAEGEVIPAMRVTRDMVFEAPLHGAAAGLKPGSLADVAEDGLSIANTSAVKNVQIIAMDGTAAGDLCRCRFVKIGQEG